MFVMFSSLVGCAIEWFEVGLKHIVQFQGKEVSNDLKVEYRREVFQRFMFDVFKQLCIYSRVGFLVGGELVIPPIYMVFSDHKKGGMIFGMKSAGGTRDGTICEMISNPRGYFV